MTDTLHSFLEEKLRLALTHKVSGLQLDGLVRKYLSSLLEHWLALTYLAHLATLFKVVRPSLTPADIFIAVSEPSVCDAQHCCCKSQDCRLDKYQITIFIDRREQGRRVTRPWVRAFSTESFEDAVDNLMATADEMIEKVKPDMTPIQRNKSTTCLVEVLLDSLSPET
jgi:hypothetical protein